MEDPCSNIYLIPRHLVMSRNCCFYCHEQQSNSAVVSYNLGINHCEKHKGYAERDCRAYMYRRRVIRLSDVLRIDCFGRLISCLNTMKQGFCVIRTNGEIESGWAFQDTIASDPRLVAKHENTWLFPVFFMYEPIRKYIPLEMLETPEILEQIKQNTTEPIKDILQECLQYPLNDIYKKEEAEYRRLEAQELSITPLPTGIQCAPSNS